MCTAVSHTYFKQLQELVCFNAPRLLKIPGERAALPLSEGKWSRKEILGHLCDSAVNNYVRFVHLQLTSEIYVVEKYFQNDWVELANYQAQDWKQIVSRWEGLNLGLSNLFSTLEKKGSKGNVQVEGQLRPLSCLFSDYLGHCRHHLQQILPDENHTAIF